MDTLNRCMVGVRIPADLQRALVEVQVALRRKAGADLVRWTPGPELFLTLAALGEITPEEVYRLQANLRPLANQFQSMAFEVDGLGGHPTNLQPRVVYASIGGELHKLEALDRAVESAVGHMLKDHMGSSMKAHIPLGRLKQESEAMRSALGRALRVAGIGHIGTLTVDAFEFVRLASTGAGPTMVTVERYQLL